MISAGREHAHHPEIAIPEPVEAIEREGDPDLEEDVDDEPTEIGAAAMAPIRVQVPQEPKKE